MKTSEDIELLRSAEQEAQGIIAAAQETAKRIRSETEVRMAELIKKTEGELTSLRERRQSDGRSEGDALLAESRKQVALACKEVSMRLESGKVEAVTLVVGELMTL